MTLLAFGPEAPAFGSWEWIGADLYRALRGHVDTTTFRDDVPECDVAIFVKFKPDIVELKQIRRRCRALVYCPVDIYGSGAEIDADAESLRCFDRIVIHAERLRKYFCHYAQVEYLDHHLKFAVPPPTVRNENGPILWVGNSSNLDPVVEWINGNPLPGPIWILTHITDGERYKFGVRFDIRREDVRIEDWTAERHRECLKIARAAFDVKGNDFRARHKPATKAIDFLASGVPFAMNGDSSSSEHLRQVYDFELVSVTDIERWLSPAYWSAVQLLTTRLRESLSLDQVAARFLKIVAPLVNRNGRF